MWEMSSVHRMLQASLREPQQNAWSMEADWSIDLMPMDFFAPEVGVSVAEMPPLPTAPPSEVERPKNSAPSSALPAPRRHKKARMGTTPQAQDDAKRAAAVKQWVEVVEAISGSCSSLHSGPAPSSDEMEDHLATKQTGTLLIRASAWRLFLRFAAATKVDTHDLSEGDVYGYLSHLKKTGAPASRARAFMQACGFAYGTCGFRVGGHVMASPRCNGAAALCMHRKRARRQRDVLKARWLELLELEVFITSQSPEDSRFSLQEAAVGGFVLFCTHGRLRCSDGARIQVEPTLDEAPGPDADLGSTIEAVMKGSDTKTGNTKSKTDVLFPATGLSKGLAGVDWAEAWLDIRGKLGMDAEADHTLMPKPLTDGSFAANRIEAGQLTEWMRHLLELLGVDRADLTNVGSHSCKATLLSIAAKAGMAKEMRRTLGAHAVPGDKSVEAYSRDNLAAPLRELAKLLRVIRTGGFDPDSTRSGRWIHQPVEGREAPRLESCMPCGQDLGSRPCFRCECGAWSHCGEPCSIVCEGCGDDMCGTCEESHDHACYAPLRDDEDESSDDDDDDVEMALEEEEAETQREETSKPEFLEKGASRAEEAEFPIGGIILHKYSRVAHRSDDNCKPACGTRLAEKNAEMHLSPESLEGVDLCWRSGCAPWKKATGACTNEFAEDFLFSDGASRPRSGSLG